MPALGRKVCSSLSGSSTEPSDNNDEHNDKFNKAIIIKEGGEDENEENSEPEIDSSTEESWANDRGEHIEYERQVNESYPPIRGGADASEEIYKEQLWLKYGGYGLECNLEEEDDERSEGGKEKQKQGQKQKQKQNDEEITITDERKGSGERVVIMKRDPEEKSEVSCIWDKDTSWEEKGGILASLIEDGWGEEKGNKDQGEEEEREEKPMLITTIGKEKEREKHLEVEPTEKDTGEADNDEEMTFGGDTSRREESSDEADISSNLLKEADFTTNEGYQQYIKVKRNKNNNEHKQKHNNNNNTKHTNITKHKGNNNNKNLTYRNQEKRGKGGTTTGGATEVVKERDAVKNFEGFLGGHYYTLYSFH